MSTLDGRTPAEHAQRMLAEAHHAGHISGGAYAFGCNVVEQMTYFAKPECTKDPFGYLGRNVLSVCFALDVCWVEHKRENSE